MKEITCYSFNEWHSWLSKNYEKEERAFYDALADCKEAIDVLGDEELRTIALELVNMVRSSVKIDWTIRESVQADLRLKVKRILKVHGYPPAGREKAIELVLKQAGVVASDWAQDSYNA